MKKSRKPKSALSIHVWEECWQTNIYCIAPTDGPALAKWIYERFKVKCEEQLHSGICFALNEGRIIIGLRKWKGTPEDWGLLSHECNHASVIILKNAGVTIGADDGEVLCYLQQSLVRRFGEELQKGG